MMKLKMMHKRQNRAQGQSHPLETQNSRMWIQLAFNLLCLNSKLTNSNSHSGEPKKKKTKFASVEHGRSMMMSQGSWLNKQNESENNFPLRKVFSIFHIQTRKFSAQSMEARRTKKIFFSLILIAFWKWKIKKANERKMSCVARIYLVWEISINFPRNKFDRYFLGCRVVRTSLRCWREFSTMHVINLIQKGFNQ